MGSCVGEYREEFQISVLGRYLSNSSVGTVHIEYQWWDGILYEWNERMVTNGTNGLR